MEMTASWGFLTLEYAMLVEGEQRASVEVTADFNGVEVMYTVAATEKVEDEMTELVSRVRRLTRCVETGSGPVRGDVPCRAYESLGVHVALEHLSSKGLTLALAVREPGSDANSMSVRCEIARGWADDFRENLEDGVRPCRHPLSGNPASRRRY